MFLNCAVAWPKSSRKELLDGLPGRGECAGGPASFAGDGAATWKQREQGGGRWPPARSQNAAGSQPRCWWRVPA